MIKPVDYPLIEPITDLNRPFWSVMIPTMDRPHYLEQALKSVLAQKIPSQDMQIEVVGDDLTPPSIQKLVENISEGKAVFSRQKGRRSQAEQWTTCIRRAKGRWVHVFHDDDVLTPGFYQTYQTFIEKYPEAILVFCRAFSMNEEGEPGDPMEMPPENKSSGIVRNALEHLIICDYIAAPSAVVKRDIYEKIGGPDPNLHYALDWELFLRVTALGPIGYIHDPHIFYRQHSKTVSIDFIRRGMNMDESRKVVRRGLPFLPTEVRPKIWKKFQENGARRSLRNSSRLLETRYFRGAWRQTLWALCLQPSRKGFVQLARILFYRFFKFRKTVHQNSEKTVTAAAENKT